MRKNDIWGDDTVTDLDSLFYSPDKLPPIEGYLGDDHDDLKLLFILREPNSAGKEADQFWMKNKLARVKNHEIHLTDNIYPSALAAIANICKPSPETDNIEFLEKYCAFINLNPVKGKGSTGTEYTETSKQFEKKDNTKTLDSLGNNRRQIINALPAGVAICTVGDIATALRKLYQNTPSNKQIVLPYVKDGKEKIKKCQIFTISTETGPHTVYTFYHPAYLRRLGIKMPEYRVEPKDK